MMNKMNFKLTKAIDPWTEEEGEYELFHLTGSVGDVTEKYVGSFDTAEEAKKYAQRYKDAYTVEYFPL